MRQNNFCFVTAKYSMRRGVAPSRIPTAGTTFPLDTLLFNASLFLFSRGQLYTKAELHVARESTVVPETVCGWHYIEINACAESKCELQNEYAASRISNCVSYIIGLSPIGFSNIVTTRETECAAYHESIAAGSPSDVRSG